MSSQPNQQGAGIGSSAKQGYTPNGFVPLLVSAQAAATPNAPALAQGKLSLTYIDLDRRADHLAHILRSLGVGPDIVVGVYLNRSPAMVVAALAILKAGGAYLPLDPTYPKERLVFLLKDAQTRILVTGHCMVDGLPMQPEHLVTLDPEGRLGVPDAVDKPIAVELKPENLAYVIYTSGSTGRPKGVELTHRGLTNLVLWQRRAISIAPTDRASQLAALSFDAVVFEVWPCLAAGASLHLADGFAVSDPEAVRDWLISRRITICFLPTPLAELVLKLDWPRTSSLRVMNTAADMLHHYPPRSLPFELVNNYGPTECTCASTAGTVFPEEHPEQLPTIGRPIDNTQIYILNEKIQQVRTGDVGEIYIGGPGLARGYRNRPDLTSERFIPNPFSSEPGARLYKTGDFARYLPDGQIAFQGRIDEQIKIRGFRVEPSEIVKVLNEHPAVQASVVVAREIDPGDKRLVAYLVLARDAQSTYTEMRNFMATRLPDYMLPVMFVTLPALPLTPSGKVNRAALPAPNTGNTLHDAPFVAPRTAIEQRVASIVGELLGVGQLSSEDNFFLLGGYSLLGAHLTVRLRNEFGIELNLAKLFEAQTVALLSREIESHLSTKSQSMNGDQKKGLAYSSLAVAKSHF
jgi:amino acid adenylation domain-containing protein